MAESHQKIVKYNSKLSESEDNFNLLDYVKAINNMYNKPIDISFMDGLIGYITQYTPCIPHTLLVKYEVFTSNNISSHVNRALNEGKYVEDVDYSLLSNVGEKSDTSRGIKYKNMYY